MPEASPTEDTDFSAQMQALVIEAEQALGEKPQKIAERRNAPTDAAPPLALVQMLRPLLVGMEALMRTQSSQTLTLERMEKAFGAHAGLPEVISDAKHSLDQRNVVNRAMFDALHAELKQYRHDFLLESVVRPVVRDLITLYDDAREIHRQVSEGLEARAEADAGPLVQTLRTLCKNLEHHIHYVLEVLERMEVRLVPVHTGKLDKRNQKVVARVAAANEAEDLVIARSVRPGFTWRERPFRPEEVVVKKWGGSPSPEGDADVQEPPPA